LEAVPPIQLEHRHVGLLHTNDDVAIYVDHRRAG